MADASADLHIAVLAFPFGTHAAPLLTLTQRLSAAAPTIKFSFLSTPNSNSLSFPPDKSTHFPNIKPFDVPDGWPGRKPFSGNIQAAVECFLAVAAEGFKKGIEEAERQRGARVSCLLTDAFLWFSADLAAEKGVPWVPFWTSGGCALSAHLNTDLIRSTLGNNGRSKNADQNLRFIPGLSAVHADHLPEGVLHGDLESPMALMLHKMGLVSPEATAIVLNSFEELEPEISEHMKSKFRKVLHVGPYLPSSLTDSKSDMNGCLSWLDGHNSSVVAYISFGTITTPPPEELLALSETLQACKTPFLWSMRENTHQNLSEGFVEKTRDFGKVVLWAPQVKVLAHPSVGVFVTHCGWNSILESITGGVPMICRPFFGDQDLNSQMVQEVWKIGMRIEGGVFSKSGTTKALESVFLNEEGKKMRENIRILKEKVKESGGPSGTSTANFRILLDVIKKGSNHKRD